MSAQYNFTTLETQDSNLDRWKEDKLRNPKTLFQIPMSVQHPLKFYQVTVSSQVKTYNSNLSEPIFLFRVGGANSFQSRDIYMCL